MVDAIAAYHSNSVGLVSRKLDSRNMNRTAFIITLVIITAIVVMASLPEQAYKSANTRTFLIATAITFVLTAAALISFLYIYT
jgi:hypothetical protein